MRQHEKSIFLKNFSAALKQARGNRSQAEMARLLDIPNQQTYQRYEKGINEPLVSAAHAICSKIGVSLEQLLTDGDHPCEISEKPAAGTTADTPTPSRDRFPRVQDAVDFIADQMGVDKIMVLEAIMSAIRDAATTKRGDK